MPQDAASRPLPRTSLALGPAADLDQLPDGPLLEPWQRGGTDAECRIEIIQGGHWDTLDHPDDVNKL